MSGDCHEKKKPSGVSKAQNQPSFCGHFLVLFAGEQVLQELKYLEAPEITPLYTGEKFQKFNCKMADEKGEQNAGNEKLNAILKRFNEIWPKFVPYSGVFSYFTLSTNALHLPVVQKFLEKDSSRVFTNGCFALSHFGTAVYIYHRPSLSLYPTKERLLYSLFGSTVFNLGSVLTWSILQAGLPKDELGKGLVGFACSLTYLYVGYRYLRSVDRYMVQAFKAGQQKLAVERCEEVKERLETSHHEFEDQEIEVDLEDDMWGSGDERMTVINVGVNRKNVDKSAEMKQN